MVQEKRKKIKEEDMDYYVYVNGQYHKNDPQSDSDIEKYFKSEFPKVWQISKNNRNNEVLKEYRNYSGRRNEVDTGLKKVEALIQRCFEFAMAGLFSHLKEISERAFGKIPDPPRKENEEIIDLREFAELLRLRNG